jgi:hypothetical protein
MMNRGKIDKRRTNGNFNRPGGLGGGKGLHKFHTRGFGHVHFPVSCDEWRTHYDKLLHLSILFLVK